jgi:poly(beta-D-mannuronate) lyase
MSGLMKATVRLGLHLGAKAPGLVVCLAWWSLPTVSWGQAGGGVYEGQVHRVHDADALCALPELRGGDMVVIAAGEYADVVVTIKTTQVSADRPVYVYADPLGSAVFTGLTRIVLDGDWITLAGLRFERGGATHREGVIKFDNGTRHSRVTNCVIDRFNAGKSDCNWVFVRGFDHRVDHCVFVGKTTRNATLAIKPNQNPHEEAGEDTPRRHRIDHNTFGPRDQIGDNGYESIRIGDSRKQRFRMNCVVENNYFFQSIKADDAREMEVISNKSRGNIYRGNVFEDCDGQLTLRHGRDCVVENNWFLGTGGAGESGVRVIGSGHVIRGNFFDNVDGSGLRSALCVMDGKYGDDQSNRYEAVEDVSIIDNLFRHCRHPVTLGHPKGPTDPPRGLVFSGNRILSNEDAPLFAIETDVRFARLEDNRVRSLTGVWGDLPAGTRVDANLSIKPGEKPVERVSCLPSFLGGPADSFFRPAESPRVGGTR